MENKKFSIEQILTYSYCPMLYKYIYEESVNINVTIQNEYNNAFRKTIFGFLASYLKNDPGYRLLKIIWGDTWIKSKKASEILFSDPNSWRDRHNEKRKTGINSLKSFYDYFVVNCSYPLFFNKEYSIAIGDVIITGTFDIVCEDAKESIQLMSIKAPIKKLTSFHIDKDFEVTAMSYAFRQIFKVEEDEILIFDSERGKVTKTYRRDSDFDNFHYAVNMISNCIENKIYYMCPDSRCYNCSCKKICSNK